MTAYIEGQKVKAIKCTGRSRRWCKATVRIVYQRDDRYVVQFRDGSSATLFSDEIREMQEKKP